MQGQKKYLLYPILDLREKWILHLNCHLQGGEQSR